MTPKGNLTLSVGYRDTWKIRACIWELLSFLERCWASSAWTKSCHLLWACSSVFSIPFPWKVRGFLHLMGVALLGCHLQEKSLGFPKSGSLYGLPGISFIEMKCSFDWNCWNFCLDFSLSQNFIQKKEVREMGSIATSAGNAGWSVVPLHPWGSASTFLGMFYFQGCLLENYTQQLCASEPRILINSGEKKAFHGPHLSTGSWAVLLKIQMLIMQLQSYKF